MNKKNFLLFYIVLPISMAWASDSHIHSEVYELDDFIVQSSPLSLSQSQKTQSTSVIKDAELEAVRSESIASILANQPGIAQTNYGPNANRPIIRGLDGFRVVLLENGLSAFDLSATSADHAVSINPLLVNRIEILRGASSLIYGSNSIGGLVNVFDNSIPSVLSSATFENQIRTHYSSVNDGYTTGGIFFHQEGDFVFQVNGLVSDTEDYKTPRYELEHHGHEHEHVQFAKIISGTVITGELDLDDDHDDHAAADVEYSEVVENTHSETKIFGFGGTYNHDNGFIGLSFSDYDSAYGVPNHEQSVISIDKQKVAFQNYTDFDSGLFDSLNFQLSYGDYTHSEGAGAHDEVDVDLFHLEGTVVEPITHDEEDDEHGQHHASFIYEGIDSSLLLTKKKDLSSYAFSFNFSDSDMKIEGEESYLAAMKHHADQNDENSGTLDESANLRILNDATKRYGLAISQRKIISPVLSVNGGIRYDAVSCYYDALTRVEDHDDHADRADFKRNDSSVNASAGFVLKQTPSVTLSANFHYAERIPETSELYSSGVHHATESFELGNPDLKNEESIGVEFSVSTNEGEFNQKLSLYYNDYDNFIYQAYTGFKTGTDTWRRPTAEEVAADATSTIPLDASRDLIRAEFEELSIREYKGVEARIYGLEYQYNYQLSSNAYISGFADIIKAQNETDAMPLPRMSPWRAGLSYHFCNDVFSFDISSIYHGKQNDLGEEETATGSYTLVDCRLGYFLHTMKKSSELYFKVNNITNELGFTHSSFLKNSAPLPGRNVEIGINYNF